MVSELFAPLLEWLSSLSLFTKVLLSFATTVCLIDFVLRRVAPGSAVYAHWKRGIHALGTFWTAIILGIVYFVPVCLTHLGLRTVGADPLDRKLQTGSAWHPHEPSPEGPRVAARRQF